MRLFVAIELPGTLRSGLERISCGLPRARWVPIDQRHLTLRFIGAVDGGKLDDIIAVLETVRASAFALRLTGVGCFPPRRNPRVLWAGIEKSEPLMQLKQKIDRALGGVGIPPDSRKFFPHVTLARVARTPIGRTARFLADHAAFSLPSFTAASFLLFSSQLTPGGAVHHPEAEFFLDG